MRDWRKHNREWRNQGIKRGSSTSVGRPSTCSWCNKEFRYGTVKSWIASHEEECKKKWEAERRKRTIKNLRKQYRKSSYLKKHYKTFKAYKAFYFGGD